MKRTFNEIEEDNTHNKCRKITEEYFLYRKTIDSIKIDTNRYKFDLSNIDYWDTNDIGALIHFENIDSVELHLDNKKYIIYGNAILHNSELTNYERNCIEYGSIFYIRFNIKNTEKCKLFHNIIRNNDFKNNVYIIINSKIPIEFIFTNEYKFSTNHSFTISRINYYITHQTYNKIMLNNHKFALQDYFDRNMLPINIYFGFDDNDKNDKCMLSVPSIYGDVKLYLSQFNMGYALKHYSRDKLFSVSLIKNINIAFCEITSICDNIPESINIYNEYCERI
jgi:hypothetical protein